MKKTILMADDDEDDSFLAKDALETCCEMVAFSRVDDGVALMDYLSERSCSGVGELPDLILLDLNMPRKDGREALLEIKTESSLKHIPIVVLTTSGEEKDIDFCMKAGANSFITKPRTFNEWVNIMESIVGNWLVSAKENVIPWGGMSQPV